jgi:DNA-binding LacI/PurR family transcriptional regulator
MSANAEGRPVVAPTAHVTMADIAREAGVSQSTVSRVLNVTASSIPISNETRDRVMATARRLGYRPNPLARGLRGASTMLLGVIVRDIVDPFFGGAIEAVTTAAAAHGYNVVLGHAHGRADEAILLRSVLETRHVDAILVLGDMGDQPRMLEDLRGDHVPVVTLWQGSASHGLPTVSVDNAVGITQALDHLLALGHRRIGFVSGRPLGDIEERKSTFETRMRAEGLGVPAGFIQQVRNDPAGGAEALAALMALRARPTAVVCSTDQLAIGVLHSAAVRGLAVPGELSVVGFDDLPISAFTVPSLTTIRMPVHEMAARAVRLAIEGAPPVGSPMVEVLRPELIVRQSTGASLEPPEQQATAGSAQRRRASAPA